MQFKYLCIPFLLLTNFAAQSQGRQSFLYNAKGQLLLDTSLTISHEQYKTWLHAEINLVAGFSRFEFPPVYLENGIKPKNILVATFVCDTFDLKDIKVLNDSSGYAIAVMKGLQKQGKGIATQLKTSSRSTSEGIYMGKYYVAINFMLTDFYEQLKIQKAVPIIKGTTPMVGD